MLLPLISLISSLIIPQVAFAAPAVTLPQPINYDALAATQITARPFSTNPRGQVAGIQDGDIHDWFGSAPQCSEDGSAPQLEIFLVNKDQCIVQDDSITYKLLIRNLGEQDAYNVKLEVDIPKTATLINGNFPIPFVGTTVPGDTILEFHNNGSNAGVYQALLNNNGTTELDFTLHIDQVEEPFTVTARLVYQSCGGRKDRYTCLQNCLPPCILACQDERTQCKNTCTDQLSSCGTACSSVSQACNALCTRGTPAQQAACTAYCAAQDTACNGNCSAVKQSCDTTCDDNYTSCTNNCSDNCAKTCDRTIQTSTSLTINGTCEQPNVNPTAIPSKQPAIICGPGDYGCQNSLPKLGFNFQNAKAWLDNPQLGARFKEAIMSIVPGDCSVLSDWQNIILPPFHDALNRGAKPAADFMIPLYNSGADFSQLAHENELLGITNSLNSKGELGKIQSAAWQTIGDAINKVLNKSMSTNEARGLVDQAIQQYDRDTKNKQQELATLYQKMQQDRLGKFDPVAQAAINNAKQSICRSCPICGSDGGLANFLPAVKQAYQQSLQDREQAYITTQANYLGYIGMTVKYTPATWKPALLQALTAVDNGDSNPLHDFVRNYIDGNVIAFNEGWQKTYGVHAEQDKAADTDIRFNNWQKTLDAPKAIAAKCEADKTFAAPVENSWCESNGYPELVIKGAPNPAKAKEVAPPAPISGGESESVITHSNVCGGGPGDPYWANDCSCHCGDIIVCDNGKVAKCGACPNHPISQDDIFVTSQKECFLSKTVPYTMGDQSFPPSDYSPPPPVPVQ